MRGSAPGERARPRGPRLKPPPLSGPDAGSDLPATCLRDNFDDGRYRRTHCQTLSLDVNPDTHRFGALAATRGYSRGRTQYASATISIVLDGDVLR